MLKMDGKSPLGLERRQPDRNAGSREEQLNLSFEFLKDITRNFSADLKLGRGSFGVVYKGFLINGKTVAVKRLYNGAPAITDKQFRNESHLLGLKHENVVRCLGYCSEAQKKVMDYKGKPVVAEIQEKLICLEYVPNGSLDEHIKAVAFPALDWNKSYKIIKGICCGLHFLHEESQTNTPIIHLDLKPSNILLTNDMVPKITDFGLSRLFGEQQTRIYTKNKIGTRGYMAPEFLHRGKITKKSDIFSLGVIVLEMITGNKKYPWSYETKTGQQNYVETEVQKWRERMMEDFRSTFVENNCRQIKKCIEIGLKCVNTDDATRPTAKEIIESFNRLDCTNAKSSRVDSIPTVKGLRHGPNLSPFTVPNDGPSSSFFVPEHLAIQYYQDHEGLAEAQMAFLNSELERRQQLDLLQYAEMERCRQLDLLNAGLQLQGCFPFNAEPEWCSYQQDTTPEMDNNLCAELERLDFIEKSTGSTAPYWPWSFY